VNKRFYLTFLIFAIPFALVMVSMREPCYHGRKLTSWLQQCYDTPLDETNRLQEAQYAVRFIGSKKALPKLLSLAKAKDDPVSLWIIQKSKQFRISSLRWRSAEDFQQLGIAGFEVLETNAAPAVGELTKLLDDDEQAFTAVRCLVAIGTPAEAGVSKALTNKNEDVRYFATQQYEWVTDDVEVYLARMRDCLQDPDRAVRFAAVQGIGLQTQSPSVAAPLLIQASKDKDHNVSTLAVKSLKAFGITNSAAAKPK
jgi:HEAT repeats